MSKKIWQLSDMKKSPYWWEEAPVKPLPPETIRSKVDVAIVGAGYTGLFAALTLARAGRSVAVFDSMNPGEGASSRNGGVTSGHIRPSHGDLTRRFGKDRADGIETEGKLAREFLYNFIASEKLNCDFSLVGRFVGAMGLEQYDSLCRDAEYLQRRLGIEAYGVPYAKQHAFIGTDFYRGGAVRMDVGGLHPAKFFAEVLRVTLASGVSVHSNTAVKSIDMDANGFRVVTSTGSINARQVLACTNGYTDGALPWLRRRMVPVRSRMIATEELASQTIEKLIPRLMMLTENRRVGFYYRPSPDGKRILLGGRDASQVGDPEEPVRMLRRGLISIFPELENVRITHTWFGNVAMHRDMIPRIFSHKGITYAAGCCGSGVVWGPWIGSRAAYKLLKEDEQEVSAFDFRPPAAVPFYSGKPWFMPAFIRFYRFQDQISWKRQSR